MVGMAKCEERFDEHVGIFEAIFLATVKLVRSRPSQFDSSD